MSGDRRFILDPEWEPSRRGVLAASGVGITTMMLPAAANAASALSADFAPSTQVTYVSGDVPIVSWSSYALADQTSEEKTFTDRPSDYRNTTLVSSAAQRPNPTAFEGANSNIDDGKISFSQFSDTATTTDWIVRNPSSVSTSARPRTWSTR